MKGRIFNLFFSLFPGFLIASGFPVFAADPPGKFEVALSLGSASTRLDTLYSTRYSTPFNAESVNMSSASQTLAINGRSSLAIGGSVSYFPGRSFGIQVHTDYFSSSLYGQNEPYEISFKYIGIDWPYPTPVERTVESSIPWPDTEGKLRHLTLSLNGIVRFEAGRKAAFYLSAGLSYFLMRGEIASLGYSKFWMGGHAVLYSEHARLRASLESAHKIGGNAAIGVKANIFENIFLFLEGRYFYCPKMGLKITPTQILNQEEIYMPSALESLSRIGEIMNLTPIKLNPSYVGIQAGLGVQF
jgi:opacity protein-like surface antigen